MVMESTYQWRKNAPAHFWGRASNARFCAYVLYHLPKLGTESLINCAGYYGTPSVGLGEGYLREASLAIELALKGRIAALKIDVPKTHDLGKLWSLARAPKLEEIDFVRLRNFRTILEWAGRYATPTKEEYFLRDIKEGEYPAVKTGFYKPLSLGWEHFDRIYSLIPVK